MNLVDWVNSAPKEKLNPITWFKKKIYLHRINRAVRKWNSDIPYINECIEKESTEDNHRGFYWNQLVWQEINMYIRMGEKIAVNEFCWLCDRRGFTLLEQNYLQSMMQYIGLMK